MSEASLKVKKLRSFNKLYIYNVSKTASTTLLYILDL